MNDTPLMLSFPSAEDLSTLIPGYRDFTFIAKGGIGGVYSATQDQLDRKVAIKILPKELGEDAESYNHFSREAHAMVRLQHPSLISIYDFGKAGDFPFLVMEYVDGKSLHSIIYGEKIPLKEAARITIALCEGLKQAHKSGVVHKGVSPGNIFMDQENTPRIGDFGITLNTRETSSPSHLGMEGYAAPEVISSPEQVNHQADIYSVGVILYQMLTGFLPPDFKPEQDKKLPDDLSVFQDIIAKATSLRLRDRYHNIGSMKNTIMRRLEKGLHNYKTVPSPILTDPITKRPDKHVPQEEKSDSLDDDGDIKKKTISLSLTVIALFLTLCGAFLFMLNRKGKSPPYVLSFPPPNITDPAIQPLKEALLKLDFSKLPSERTTYVGGKPIYLCSTKMTWYHAQSYAQSLGGYLSPADNPLKKEKLAKLLGNGEPAWIGMGTVGNGAWQDVYGNKLPKPKMESKVNVGAFSSLGLPLAAYSGAERHFFIEWDNRKAFRYSQNSEFDSLKKEPKNRTFPLGTMSNGRSHYLIVNNYLLHQEALEYLEEKGATLLNISDEKERIFLEENLKRWTGAPRSFWIKDGTLSVTSDELFSIKGTDPNVKIPLILEWETP